MIVEKKKSIDSTINSRLTILFRRENGNRKAYFYCLLGYSMPTTQSPSPNRFAFEMFLNLKLNCSQ